MSSTFLINIIYLTVSVFYPSCSIYKLITNNKNINKFWLLYFIFYYIIIFLDENFFYPLTDL